MTIIFGKFGMVTHIGPTYRLLSYSMFQVTEICDLIKSQIKSQKFKSNPSQIKGFQIKSFFTQIK